jgi:hypothetical protein
MSDGQPETARSYLAATLQPAESGATAHHVAAARIAATILQRPGRTPVDPMRRAASRAPGRSDAALVMPIRRIRCVRPARCRAGDANPPHHTRPAGAMPRW